MNDYSIYLISNKKKTFCTTNYLHVGAFFDIDIVSSAHLRYNRILPSGDR
jgi:hypothetical protein